MKHDKSNLFKPVFFPHLKRMRFSSDVLCFARYLFILPSWVKNIFSRSFRKKKKGGKPATAQQGKEAEKKPAGANVKESLKPAAIKEAGGDKAKERPAAGAAPDKEKLQAQVGALAADGRPITKHDHEHEHDLDKKVE